MFGAGVGHANLPTFKASFEADFLQWLSEASMERAKRLPIEKHYINRFHRLAKGIDLGSLPIHSLVNFGNSLAPVCNLGFKRVKQMEYQQFVEKQAPVSVFAVGYYIAAASPIAFTADIKAIEDRPIAKRGRIPGLVANPRLSQVL